MQYLLSTIALLATASAVQAGIISLSAPIANSAIVQGPTATIAGPSGTIVADTGSISSSSTGQATVIGASTVVTAPAQAVVAAPVVAAAPIVAKAVLPPVLQSYPTGFGLASPSFLTGGLYAPQFAGHSLGFAGNSFYGPGLLDHSFLGANGLLFG